MMRMSIDEEKDTAKAEQCTGSIVAYNNAIKIIDKHKMEQEEVSFTDECKKLNGDCGKCLYKHNCCSSEFNGRH